MISCRISDSRLSSDVGWCGRAQSATEEQALSSPVVVMSVKRNPSQLRTTLWLDGRNHGETMTGHRTTDKEGTSSLSVYSNASIKRFVVINEDTSPTDLPNQTASVDATSLPGHLNTAAKQHTGKLKASTTTFTCNLRSDGRWSPIYFPCYPYTPLSSDPTEEAAVC